MASRRNVRGEQSEQSEQHKEKELTVPELLEKVNQCCLVFEGSDELADFLSAVAVAKVKYGVLVEKVKFMEEYTGSESEGGR